MCILPLQKGSTDYGFILHRSEREGIVYQQYTKLDLIWKSKVMLSVIIMLLWKQDWTTAYKCQNMNFLVDIDKT